MSITTSFGSNDDRYKTASGWIVIHDFLHGWGLQEPVVNADWGAKRTIYLYELPEYLRGNAKYMTATGLEQVWPVILEKRAAWARRVAAMPKPKPIEKFTLPKIKGNKPYPDIREILSVQPMTREGLKKNDG